MLIKICIKIKEREEWGRGNKCGPQGRRAAKESQAKPSAGCGRRGSVCKGYVLGTGSSSWARREESFSCKAYVLGSGDGFIKLGTGSSSWARREESFTRMRMLQVKSVRPKYADQNKVKDKKKCRQGWGGEKHVGMMQIMQRMQSRF